MKEFNRRLVNKLWLEPVNTLTKDDLELLDDAFCIGFLPLWDFYSDNNPIWVNWKKNVKEAIQKVNTSEKE